MTQPVVIQIRVRLARIWERFTSPHPAITNDEDAHGARLLAALLVVHVAAVVIFFLLTWWAIDRWAGLDVTDDLDSWVILGCTTLLAIPFAILKAGQYRPAAALYVALAAMVPLIAPFVDDPAAEIGNVALVIVPALIAVFVFPPRWVVAVLVGTVGIAGIRLVTAGLSARQIGTGFSILIVTTMAGLMLLMIRARAAAVERMRQARLRESELALERTSERLRAVLANSVDVILGTDRYGTVVFTGGAVLTTLGRQPDELLGRSLFERVAAEDLEATRELFARSVNAPDVPVRAEWRQSRLDGRMLHLEALFTNHLDRPGVANVLVNVREVTARREADEARARLDARLHDIARLELAGRMAGGLAHDFNNLLTIMTGHLELARSGPPGNAPEHLVKVEDAVQHATGLARQLLTFARRDVGRPTLIRPDLSLRSVEPALRQVTGPAIEFSLELDPGTGVIRFDPGTFEWAIINLAMNARDASPHGGRFTLRAERVSLPDPHIPGLELAPGPYVRVTARDSGEGMTEEAVRRLFEPFYTTKSRRVGTGLALATIHGAVVRAGGTVTVESTPGRGTTVALYFPRAGDPFETPPPVSTPDRPDASGGEETILYAEDNDQIRDMTRDALAELGYRVIAAPDGLAALAEAKGRTAPIHLLLTDLLMPGLNGRQLADAVAPLHPETRVLYTSGYSEDVLTGDDLTLGTLAFIGKPYRSTELAAKIREVLDRPAA